MSDMAVFRFNCAPGKVTPELALKCQRLVLDLLNAVADDEAEKAGYPAGSCVFKPETLTWVDDGIDEIVIRVAAER